VGKAAVLQNSGVAKPFYASTEIAVVCRSIIYIKRPLDIKAYVVKGLEFTVRKSI
jgi:hypothetical protein